MVIELVYKYSEYIIHIFRNLINIQLLAEQSKFLIRELLGEYHKNETLKRLHIFRLIRPSSGVTRIK